MIYSKKLEGIKRFPWPDWRLQKICQRICYFKQTFDKLSQKGEFIWSIEATKTFKQL